MHQFQIDPLAGELAGNPFAFTNSALWMLIVLGSLFVFMLGGMKRAGLTLAGDGRGDHGFRHLDARHQHRPGGAEISPWVFTIFMFILFANLMGLMPFGVFPGVHPFTVTSQFTITGVMAIISFSIVLVVGFWKHGFHFFSCSSRTARPSCCCRSSS